MTSSVSEPEFDVSAFFDTEAFWVIWQVGRSPRGDKRIRRITQQYSSEALARADAERFRKSGVVTWVEKASPLAPRDVPSEAIEALCGTAAASPNVAAVTLATA